MDAELNRPTRAPIDGATFKTTEFFAFVVDGNAGGDDPFNAEQAWRYITFLTIGYMLSRGLAKAGNSVPCDDHS
jgi:hypothetical protein